jgi:hypothetical protein
MAEYVEIREPMISADKVLERWPGMLDREMGAMIDADLFEDLPAAYRVDKVLSDGKGGTIAKCTRCETRGNYWVGQQGSDTIYDFTGIAFRLAEIVEHEKKNPDLFYKVVTNLDEAWSSGPPEYIPADIPFGGKSSRLAELEAQLAEAQTTIAKLKGMDFNDAPRQLTKEENELALFEYGVPALEAHLAEAQQRITSLEAELAAAKQQITEAKGEQGRRDTSAATIGKLRQDIKSWKAALPMAVSAAFAVLSGGKGARKREELRAICEQCKASFSDVQFEAWRKSLPEGYYDKDDRSTLSAYPLNTDETIAGEEE